MVAQLATMAVLDPIPLGRRLLRDLCSLMPPHTGPLKTWSTGIDMALGLRPLSCAFPTATVILPIHL